MNLVTASRVKTPQGFRLLRHNIFDKLSVAKRLDLYLILPAITLFLFGLFTIYSASRGFDSSNYDTSLLERQALFGVLGIALMLILAFVKFRQIANWTTLIYGSGILALVLVLTGLGTQHRGSQAWFDIGSYQIQPSEFMKLAVILGLASFASSFGGKISFRALIFALGIVALPILLIILQPDVGTVLIYGVIAVVVLLASGVKNKHLVLVAALTILTFVLILNSGLLQDYQEQRLTALVDPSGQESYTQTQAQIAIGNGGWTGQGFGNGTQTLGEFVPEQHTDFIFTVIGEELGFLGGVAVIILFGFLIARIWFISRFSRNMFTMLICVGVMAMILFQAFQSIGMTLGIMPVTGVPLPFVSYGGSSLVTSFMALGLVMSASAPDPDPVFA